MRRLWPHICESTVRSRTIAVAHPEQGTAEPPAVSLLFAAGARPRVRMVAALAEAGAGFAIGLTAPDGRLGTLELVANGLAFDLAGLAPEPGAALPAGFAAQQLEAIVLRPGPHLAGATGMLPMWRTLAAIAAQLAALPAVRAVVWHPSGLSSTPAAFREAVAGWADDGPVPAFARAFAR